MDKDENKPVAAALPASAKLDEDEQNALLSKIEDYMSITDKLSSQMHQDCVQVEKEIYALVDGFIAKRAAPTPPVEQPSQTITHESCAGCNGYGQVSRAERDGSYDVQNCPFCDGTGETALVEQPSQRPTDDALLDQTLKQRDDYCDMADKLAEAIAKYLGVDIGEHSNMNCPWSEALLAIDVASSGQPSQPQDQSSPIAEPDTATQAPSESIDCPEFRERLRAMGASVGVNNENYKRLVGFVNSWHQRATQVAKPLTNTGRVEICNLKGD